jgi:hypothetical protein
MAVSVFEDRIEKGDWRVEYFDDDGSCYLTLFAGPAEQRARAYHAALEAGTLKVICAEGTKLD